MLLGTHIGHPPLYKKEKRREGEEKKKDKREGGERREEREKEISSCWNAEGIEKPVLEG